MAVLVLDRKKRPLMPCTPKRARKLLASGRARVHLLFPFCIRLVDRSVEHSAVQPLRLSLDPGSKTTGLAVSRIDAVTGADGVVESAMHIVFLMELVHRGRAIMASMHARSAMRRRRRGNLRYRAPRFSNRTRPAGWLAPSLRHRIDTASAWVARFLRLEPHHATGAGIGPIRHAADAKPRDFRRRVPAGHARRIRSARVPARKIRPHLRLLRRERPEAGGGIHPRQVPRRLGPRVEPDHSL